MPITLDTLRQALAETGFKRSVRQPRPNELCDFINTHLRDLEAILDAGRLIVRARRETVLFGHVGNIRPHKGHSNLIAATDLLRRDLDDFVVVSVGGEKYPGDLERLQAEVDRRALDDRIRFLGRREDAIEIMAACDIMVNPSDHEGLPLAVLEAMTLGLPVVATAVGGVPGAIVDGTEGLLVPAADPEALAGGMLALAVDDELRGRLARSGQSAARERYGLERMVRAVEALYDELLSRNADQPPAT